MTKLFYAAVGPDGSVVDVSDDPFVAANQLITMFPEARISIQEVEETPRENPAAREMPKLALQLSGLSPITPKQSLKMSLDEAHARLEPYFTNLPLRGEKVVKYESPSGMADAWIGQNYKTSKPSQDPGRPAQVMGVSLVPAQHARLAAHGQGPYQALWIPSESRPGREASTTDSALAQTKKVMLAKWRREDPGLTGKFTLCAGSSQDCRDSCLVFAGQNASERYNTYRKVAQTMALLNEPAAFLRMLVESIEMWMRELGAQCGCLRPFVRLNVLSDVPWELVAPWLFEHFEGASVGTSGDPLMFYDYTKVAGRRTPKNYDLTFSVSGTDANRAWAKDEIERGRRIAVVFLGHKKVGESWQQIRPKGPTAIAQMPLPRTFWGLKVIDGDISDVRPYDPAPACVGLRWKTPSGKRAGVEVDPGASAFVTPVYIVDDRGWLAKPNPSSSAEQWLIAAVTPRQQPIIQPMTQPG